MGRIVELITDVAASADEEGATLTLPMGDFDRLRDDWGDDEIEDALALAQTAFHHEAVNEAADSLCARVIEVLGTFADEKRFASCSEPGAPLPVESLANLARSVAYLEEALSLVRDAPPPTSRSSTSCSNGWPIAESRRKWRPFPSPRRTRTRSNTRGPVVACPKSRV